MNLIIKTFGLLLLSIAVYTTHASGLEALEKFNNSVSSISGNFTQTLSNKKGYQTTSGTFSILRPNLFRWEYSKPYIQTIVADGSFVWLYDYDLKQVTKIEQNNLLNDTPASIITNKYALNSHYALKEGGAENGNLSVTATPKNNDSAYQYIRIEFNNDQLSGMELHDSFGNKTNIQFSNISINAPMKAENFHFNKPKDVDVIRQ